MSTRTSTGEVEAATTAGLTPDALLDAGAVLPWSGGPDDRPGDRADVLQARAYRHPALDGRTVVRLVPRALGEAEDLTMEFLGFDRPGGAAAAGQEAGADAVAGSDIADVGVVLRKSLGFPAWALVNDPANGHHALALVKEIERLGRQARNKPGTAKDGFDALGKRLAAAVPHFLPSYYEQVGRMFLAAENKTYAATMFSKARDAERAHGLPVDEDVLAEAFLEFALNGALPAKAVGEYAKALSARITAPEAFQRFRLLVTERTSGGLPPYSGLGADMKRLAKAAGLDVVEQEISLLRDLLDQPALLRAAKPFWVSYAASLVKLAKAEPAVRGQLLAINPDFPGANNTEADLFWLGVLADSGALDVLCTPPDEELPPGLLPADGAAGWLARFVANRSRGWRYGSQARLPELLDLVTRMAPRLRAEGTALAIVSNNGVDADLLDLCLSLGLPVAPFAEDGYRRRRFDLDSWLGNRDTPGRRDLSAFAADEYFGAVLDRALDDFADHAHDAVKGAGPLAARFDELAAVPGLLAAVARWLDRRGAEVGTGGLPLLHDVLGRIRRAASARVVAVNPEPMRRVAEFDIAPVLAKALRAGILDEYSWPALEEACVKLSAAESPLPSAAGAKFEIVEQWPYLLVKQGPNVSVVGGTGTVLEHLTPIPQADHVWNSTLRHADGQLLVIWHARNSNGAYWSGEPTRMLDRGEFGYHSGTVSSMEIPGRGRSFGGRPLRAGDTSVDEAASVVSDGTTYWRRAPGHDEKWHEFDPATGAVGRAGLPSFFEDRLPAGQSLVRHLCWVRPVVPGSENSPMGVRDGLLGWRVHQGADGAQVGEAIDGRAFRMGGVTGAGYGYRAAPVGQISFPGSAVPTAVTSAHNSWGQAPSLALTDHVGVAGPTAGDLGPDGDGDWYPEISTGRQLAKLPVGERAPKFAKGTWVVPPLSYWNYLVARDEAGSLFLRTVDADRVRALMEAAKRRLQDVDRGEREPGKDPEARPAAVAEAVRAELPEVTHPNLIAGIAGYVREAVDLEASITRIAEALSAPAESTADADPVDRRLLTPDWDQDLGAATAGLVNVGYYSSSHQPLPQPGLCLSWLVSAFHGKDVSEHWRDGEKVLHAVELLAALPSLVYRAASPLAGAGLRATVAQLVAAVAAAGFGAADSPIRGLRPVTVEAPSLTSTSRAGRVVRTENGCLVLCTAAAEWRNGDYFTFWRGVQLTGTGEYDDKLRVESDGTTDDWVVRGAGPVAMWPAGLLDRIAAALAAGPFAWDPSAVERFSAATGLTAAEAALALAGLPGVLHYAGGKLETETRNRLGLKPAQAKAAFSRYERLTGGQRTGLLAALSGAGAGMSAAVGAALSGGSVTEAAATVVDPRIAGLWSQGPDVDTAAAWWVARFGRKVVVPEELLTEAHTALKPRVSWQSRLAAADILQGVADLDDWAVLGTGPDGEAIHEYAMRDIARALLWLAYRLPYGDPLRAPLPEAARRLAARLGRPDARADAGYVDGPARIEDALGIKAVPMDPAETKAEGGVRIGPFRVRAGAGEWRPVEVVLGELSGPDDPALDLMVALGPAGATAALLRAVLGGGLERLMVVPEAGEPYPAQDPTRSVPDLVAAAARHLGLSADAAALYLMLLALPDPTDRNTAAWTGWKPARLKAARAELGATPLVVTGSRPRAGRTMFLPGGWHAFGTPVLPVEAWKARWLGIDGQGRIGLDVTVPRLPVTELFQAAWQRVLDGDPPRLEELKTGRRR